MTKTTINYSQCWEDSEVLLNALNIDKKDKILSITSGGDNTLALLLKNPLRVTSIDLNSAQNYLLELKLAAAKSLPYLEYLSFLGVTDSAQRLSLFSKVKLKLSPQAKSWWMRNNQLIELGIVNQGRFEKFLNTYRKFFLPLVHSSKTVTEFITISSIQKQREYYKKKWDTKRWRLYLRLATSKFALNNFARQKGMFRYVTIKKVSDIYLNRLASKLENISLINNHYLHYCLTGNFRQVLPAYLDKKNFVQLQKTRTDQLVIVSDNLTSHLTKIPENFYSKFNLSDIFEALSDQETLRLWTQIVRTAKPNARIVYWDNLIPSPVPKQFFDIVKREETLQKELFKKDRVFFYGSLHIYKIKK